MSVSKLESLPNEILTDILEKYINGIDVLNAFAFQLNRRFDALIVQCQRLRFDFMRCHKDDFCFCIGLLPAYINKIDELALSEQNTPGQIHAFLSFFDSFTVFKRLRKLYIHINVEAVQPTIIEKALYSLSKTTLHTLSIKITKEQTLFSLNNAIVEIFRMKTLKKLSISFDSSRINWLSLDEVSSNIEYLTIDGIFCEFQDLKSIFRCVSGLKYLNIQVNPVTYYNSYKRKLSVENNITRMSMLHTVIFKIQGDDETVPGQLEPYLRCMPSLHRLEIKMYNELFCIDVWETLLKTSVPTLTYFNMESNVSHLKADNVNNILESIQTSFWIEKRNFNVIIKQFSYLNSDRIHPDNQQNFNPHELNMAVDQWWIGPRRKLNDNPSVMSTISSLNLSTESSSLLQNRYLNNVNNLVVHEFNDNLLELIITHVNYSRIRHLDVSFLKRKSNSISSLLPYIRNIASLRINFNQLSDSRFAYLRECKNLKFLDISADQHSFDKTHMSIIASIFPNIEHLIINTQDLRNVPMLQKYIPRLRSLTFASIESNSISLSFPEDYRQKMADHNLRQKSQFLFQRGTNWFTVWVDQVALRDSYWQMTNSNSQQSRDGSWFNNLSDRISSFLN
jgi:hypothetical protein